MHSVAQDALSYILLFTWAVLNVQTYINPLFRQVLPTEDRVHSILRSLGLAFCKEFFDVVQAASPPTIAWFESLPTTRPNCSWGIYVHVLKKGGCRDLLYIGSGTAAYRGVKARLSEYDALKCLPHHVRIALDNGYSITHTSLLITCPIPSASDIPASRLAITALEAALSCIFWAMVSQDLKYGFRHLCPWSPNAFTYGGLCAHSAVMDSVHGDFSLTPAQLKELDDATKAKNQAYQHDYHREKRANPTPQYTLTHTRNNQMQAPATRARQRTAVSEQKYHCIPCDVSCRDAASLRRHNDTPRHKQRAVRDSGDWTCEPCNISFRYQSNLKQHKTSKGHISKTKNTN